VQLQAISEGFIQRTLQEAPSWRIYRRVDGSAGSQITAYLLELLSCVGDENHRSNYADGTFVLLERSGYRLVDNYAI
jgi:hypothetical protein